MNSGDPGQVVREGDLLEDLNLHDDKDLFVQHVDPAYFKQYAEKETEKVSLMLREWNPSDWSLGPTVEIEVPKNLKTYELSKLVVALYPNMKQPFACRVALLKNFVRSDLIVSKWFQLATSGVGNQYVAQS